MSVHLSAVAVPPPPIQDATVNTWGDLVCPYCDTNIMTPNGATVVPGHGTCGICKLTFRVTQPVADQANKVTASHRP